MRLRNLFVVAFTLLSTVAAEHRRRFEIGAPANGTVVQRGQKITVEVDRPFLKGVVTEVSMIIGLQSCDEFLTRGCPAPDDAYNILDKILWTGLFKPRNHDDDDDKPDYQNFTFTIPKDLSVGPTLLTILRLALDGYQPGSSANAMYQTRNVTLIVE
ncbi:hypothetical protein C8F01DRAFT_1136362 [Mycena amicta]|nr:hypothetical protein C8F01DRAFT_1136362 [Mycena amicta]